MNKTLSLHTVIGFGAAMLILFSAGCSTETDQTDPVHTSVPEWAQDAIWYQIFVERFRDGDPDNQPTLESIEGSWPHNKPDSWKVTPWGHDWYEKESWMTETQKDFYEAVHMRRYGGDLQGVIEKLDYLEDLGITAIYFNPLNDSPSLHKYDARNYRHIDVNFGPDPEGDRRIIAKEDPADPETWQWTSADKMFLSLVEEARKRGIRVVMDYSWNHTGITFWAWQHVLEHQAASPYADWYQIDRFNDPATEENEFSYPGWAGVPELPQFRRYNSVDEFRHGELIPGDLHPDLKEHIFAVSRRWLAPDGDVSRGIDGFRLDVAELIPVDFWRDYRRFVRSIQPEAILVGELWWENWPEKMMDPTEWLQGDIFDAIMNYRWYRPTRQWLGETMPGPLSPSEYVHHLDSISDGLRPEVLRAQMNLTASHDTPRFSTSIFNKGINKYQVNPRENPDYKLHRPDEATWNEVRLILAQQFTWVGAPHIWMGDELGMWGADDPDCRKPLIWPDLEFSDETTHPRGYDRPADRVEADQELLEYYRRLIHLRREHPVFSRGEVSILLADDELDLLSYGRSFGEAKAVVVLNNGQSTGETIAIPVQDPCTLDFEYKWTEVLHLQPVEWEYREEHLYIQLPEKSAAVFLNACAPAERDR
ncbi:glycoside hydrolase family 13 protein [Balneolaceae bacterium ANBcel3]|nr:glycoside hydrolase family 13 protein [Balneolaceae bacterium ANBcel3]